MLEVRIKREWPRYWRVNLGVSNGKKYLLTSKAVATSFEFEISGGNETFHYRRISKWWFKYDYGAFKGQKLLFRIYSKKFRRYIEINDRSYVLRDFLKAKEFHFPYHPFGVARYASYPESFETEGLILTGYKLMVIWAES